jgi:hypothetical protein
MLYSAGEPIKYTDPAETIGCMTDREGTFLAKAYGYVSLNALCAELHYGAAVLDMGSGLSDFGHEVTTRRPDIDWTNFDARYGDETIPADEQEAIARMQAKAPANLAYVGGNALDLPSQIRARHFDRVFSYYMFPYVIDYFGIDAAVETMENSLKLLRPNGSLSTGPIRYQDYGWTVTLPETTSIKDLAADMIKRYTESWDEFESRPRQSGSVAYTGHLG